MALQHFHLPSVEERCAYLADMKSATEYRVLSGVTPAEHERLLELGWRHFGSQYFRPVCAACQECLSLRIPVAEFKPSKSQRRAAKRCGSLRVEVGLPTADDQRLALFHAWHAMREQTRGWKPSVMTREEYEQCFCHPHPFSRELSYYEGDRLAAIGHVDLTPNAVSSAYFFYDPRLRPLGIGVASVLFEIQWALENGRSHLYLGYCVRACPSTAYKAQFTPHEILVGRPEFSDMPVWRAVE